MRINFAHINIHGLNVAVFDAKPTVDSDAARGQLLNDLANRARRLNLRVEKAALAYEEFGRIKFYGNIDLVNYLSNAGLPNWTHWMDV
jgi:hypothetical protein